jgi:hypothetical protein
VALNEIDRTTELDPAVEAYSARDRLGIGAAPLILVREPE